MNIFIYLPMAVPPSHQVTVVPFAFRWPKQPSNPKLAASPEFYDHQRTVRRRLRGGGNRHVGGWQGARVGHAEEDEETYVILLHCFLWIFGFGDKEPEGG